MSFLPQNLRHLRKKMGQSQTEISKLVDKKQNTIGNWENNVSEPTISDLAKLAQFFGVTLQDIILKDMAAEPPRELIKKEEPVGVKTPNPAYPVNEGFNSTAQEASQHQFWVLIGELRRIHDKLDSIKIHLDGKLPEKLSPPRSGL